MENYKHLESSIRKLVKDLRLKWIYITRDKDYWIINQSITNEWLYTPRYY